MLENKFKILCENYSTDETIIRELWKEIANAHSNPSRYYHTLEHLEHIDKELEKVKLTPLLAFATFYHDIVYDVRKSDNEEQSAFLAKKRLKELTVPKTLREQIFQLIVETKTHQASSEENALFLDADLSVLGSSYEVYEKYARNVRKEYVIYDDVSYFTGRKKVLKAFLEKERIYETQHFYDKYEKQARDNMLIEYNSLAKNLLKNLL